MRRLVALMCFATLLTSTASHAIVLGALGNFEKDHQIEVYGVGSALMAFSMFVKNAVGKFPMIGGVVLDSRDPNAAPIDALANLQVLARAGIVSADEVDVISADLSRIGAIQCPSPTCRFALPELRERFGVSELTLRYLASLHGIQ